MSALLETTKDGVGGRATRARYARDGDALTREEIRDGRWKVPHYGIPTVFRTGRSSLMSSSSTVPGEEVSAHCR